MRRLLLWALLGTVYCGGRGPAEKLKVVPPTANVGPGQALQFAVTPADTRVVWSVQEPAGGTIEQNGLYHAPAQWGTYHVVATATPALSASATVTVTSPVEITAPSPQAATACQPRQLVATVTGASDTSVTWGGVDPSCGAITPQGVFTSGRGNGYCLVSAQANADPTRIVTVRVDFTEPIQGVAVVPPTATVPAGGSVPFAATVTTSCGTFPAGG